MMVRRKQSGKRAERVIKKEDESEEETTEPQPGPSGIRRSRSPSREKSSERSRSDSESSSIESIDKTLEKLEKKTPKKWTNKLEKQMCALWKKETLLYDPSHSDYRSVKKRMTAVDNIASEIDMDANDVEIRMRSLRTVYGRLIKIPDESEITKRESDIFRLCSFLKDFMRANKRESSPSPVSTRSSKKRMADLHTKTSSSSVKGKDPTTPSTPTPSTSSGVAVTDDVQKDQSDPTETSPTFIQTESTFWTECFKTLRCFSERKEFDKHEFWGRHLAEQLKEMDPLSAEELKLKIDQMVFDRLKTK